ncbi:MAG TPA: LysE family transporter [Bacillota bacterium]|nr:LysE family transporter [Bacillota bacterium]
MAETGELTVVLMGIAVQAFTVGLSGAMMPGPLLTYTIQLAYKKGFRTGPQIVLGHAILEALLISGVIAGLGSVLAMPATKIGLWLIGGGLLGWMGYDLLWKESRNPALSLEETAAAREEAPSRPGLTNLHPVGAGMLISASNPYWALWWATIGLGFITKSLEYGWVGIFLFFLGHISSDLVWYSLIAAAVAGGRRFLAGRAYQALLMVCGAFLLVIAAGFVIDAIRILQSVIRV